MLTKESVVVKGWVHRIRKLKQFSFVILRNRHGLVQCLLDGKIMDQYHLELECVVSFTGTWQAVQCAIGTQELVVTGVNVYSRPMEVPAVQINTQTLNCNLETQLEHRVLTLRHLHEQGIFRIQSEIVQGFSQYLDEQGFVQVFTPKLVKEGAEGGANVFSLDYFGQQAYLAQSPQFYKQMMVIAGFERVYEIGSVFRAEAHSTSRHLNEYVSLDVEMGFIDSEQDLMLFETVLLRAILKHLTLKASPWLETLSIQLPIVPETIPQITFNEALDILQEVYARTDLDGDLDPEAERQLSAHILKETGSEFLFVTDYPERKRPMYAMDLGPKGTRSFDLLFRGVEITTGGQRIDNRLQLEEKMRRKGLEPSAYSSYLKAFNSGVPPHGGFAIGLERLTALLLGYGNVRRTSAFPRDGQRLVP